MVDFSMAYIKPTLGSLLLTTVMVVVGVTFAKWAFTQWHVPGLSELVQAV